MPGIEKEVERIMNLWIEAGVTIFRIDNPHTKPVRFCHRRFIGRFYQTGT